MTLTRGLSSLEDNLFYVVMRRYHSGLDHLGRYNVFATGKQARLKFTKRKA